MGKIDKKDDGPKLDHTGWMVTFGDLLMLLLTFFVLLFSMSSIDVKALKGVFSIFSTTGVSSDMERIITPRDIMQQGAGGAMELPGLNMINVLRDRYRKIVEEKKDIHMTNLEILKDVLTMEDDTEHDEISKDLKELIDVSEDERGLIITLQEMIMFDSGGAEIKDDVVPLLDWLAEVLGPVSGNVLIMGHTDNIPIRKGRYRSNWELSLYRALNVHDYFIEKKGFSPERFAVGGYGDLRPRFPNDTKEGRRKNRRVEIIIKKTQQAQ
ncbi:MAG: OmpA family protein [Desulfobacterales bacterium]|nr:OmpA family protein [Desulfobacterales bacterium]